MNNNLNVTDLKETENYMVMNIHYGEKKFFSQKWVTREITVEKYLGNAIEAKEEVKERQLNTSWIFNDNFEYVTNDMKKVILAKIEITKN